MNPIQIKTAIEKVLGVIRDGQGRVINYGLMGIYNYKNGFQNTAFTVGIVPEIESVFGLELVLSYPESNNIKPLANKRVYSEKCYRLTIVQRDKTAKGHDAIMLLERSAILQNFSYVFIQAMPEIGNYPQWNCKFKVYETRDRL